MKVTMDKLVALCKSRGFIFAGSDIYGGFANTWDFGPVGVELKNNVKRSWWKRFVQESPATYGVDAAILMNPRVWEASGHVASFGDPKNGLQKLQTAVPRRYFDRGALERRGCGGSYEQRGNGEIYRGARHQVPPLRREELDAYQEVQPYVHNLARDPRSRFRQGVSAPRNLSGRIREFSERAEDGACQSAVCDCADW